MNITEIQIELNERGYGPIPLYPNFGPVTKKAIEEFQYDNGLVVDGIAGPRTLAKLFPTDINYLLVSQKSIDFIIGEEVTSESYYNNHYLHPEYPGIGSGITIGIGYDLGYNSIDQIKTDWGGLVDSSTLERLISVQGVTGTNAKDKLNEVKDIIITFNQGKAVFLQSDLPKTAFTLVGVYNKVDELTPDCIGALLSLVFNRGGSTTGDSRREMYNLKQLILNKDYKGIASQIRSMKRLWDGVSDDGRESRVNGLLYRRDKEGSLVENSIRQYTNSELLKIFY